MFFCFVFGLEPWLLPPAVEMIEALKAKGHQVKVIYAEYRGEQPDPKDYDSANTFNIIPKQSGYKRILTHTYLAKSVRELLSKNGVDILIACDILSLQAISGIRGVKKGYWGFEIANAPTKMRLSFDYYRALRFPAWVRGLNFFLAPSQSRVEKIRRRSGKKGPGEVIYNCRRYEERQLNQTQNKAAKLVYTGRVSEAQYIEEIIDAMALLPPEVTLHIAGPVSDTYARKLNEKINANAKIKGRTFLLGRLNREDVYALVNSADIGFVFYNTTMSDEAEDPAPNKLSDYIAGNIWIVGGPQAYIKYWLEERHAGVCINEINKTAIAGAIEKILSGDEFNDKAVLNKLYRNELNMDVQAEKLLTLVKGL